MNRQDGESSYVHRVLIAVSIALAAIVLLYAFSLVGQVLLLAFAASLVALVIDATVRMLCRYTPLGRTGAFLSVVILLAALLVGLGIWIGPHVNAQMDSLSEQLPRAVDKVRDWLGQTRWGSQALEMLNPPQGEQAVSAGVVGRVTGAFSTVFGAIGNFLIIFLMGFYIAFNPGLYTNIAVRLFPLHRRDRIRDLLAAQGNALRLWLLARLVSMTFIGVFIAVGLKILDVPVAISLGVIAGLFTFIPYIGPFIGAIPTLLVALLDSPQTALYAALIYFTVESIESSLVTPIVERRVVQVPPALGVMAQLTAGGIFGIIGIVLAIPLAVIFAVAVQMLYIQDVLGDDVKVLGH